MKLLTTIHKIIKEAEDNLYTASLNCENTKEIQILEEKLNDSLGLLDIYKKL
jgi:hypothetical protein|tara:strand:- start:2118 stop:2273 length:156 start_codon:yes stop_codon:yes gene_type:complete